MIRSIKNALNSEEKNFCKDGKCSCCGQCCTNLLPMTSNEITRIRAYIKKHNIKPHNHIVPYAEAYDMTCPFMDSSKHEKCTIYEVRPKICREYICDKSQRKPFKPAGLNYMTVMVRELFFGKEEGEN